MSLTVADMRLERNTFTPIYQIGQNALESAEVDTDIFNRKLSSLPAGYPDEFKEVFAQCSASMAQRQSVKRQRTDVRVGAAGTSDTQGDDAEIDEEKEAGAKSEAQVQRMFNSLFRFLVFKYHGSAYRDTSQSGYPTTPNGKIDCIWLNGEHVIWTSIVKIAEIKASLTPVNSYKSAVGQIVDRVSNIFMLQPQRQYAIASVIGCDSIELWHFVRGERTSRSGLHSIQPVAGNYGFELLVRFAVSSQESVGFVPAQVLHPFDDEEGQRVEPIQCVRTNIFERQSLIYFGRRSGQPIAIKLSPLEDRRECAILSILDRQGVSKDHRIACLSHGRCHHAARDWNYMCLSPVGAPLCAGDSPLLIASVFRDIAQAVSGAHGAGVLHGDISPANIIFVNRSEPSGVLIDWHVSFILQEAAADACSVRTRSAVYSPVVSRASPYPPSCRWDWESLFFTFLGVLTDEHLPWQKADPDHMAVMKFEVVTHPNFIGNLYDERSSVPARFACFRFWLQQMHHVLFSPTAKSPLAPLSAQQLAECTNLWQSLPEAARQAAIPVIAEDDVDAVDMDIGSG